MCTCMKKWSFFFHWKRNGSWDEDVNLQPAGFIIERCESVAYEYGKLRYIHILWKKKCRFESLPHNFLYFLNQNNVFVLHHLGYFVRHCQFVKIAYGDYWNGIDLNTVLCMVYGRRLCLFILLSSYRWIDRLHRSPAFSIYYRKMFFIIKKLAK